jgi:hypothetical protein
VINWGIYNESLVRRGEIVLDFDMIDKRNNELHKMNQGKEGASYRYPDSFVQLLGYMRVYFHLPFRQTEGVVTAHAGKKAPSIPDYSTINRRVNKLVSLDVTSEEVYDGSRLKELVDNPLENNTQTLHNISNH